VSIYKQKVLMKSNFLIAAGVIALTSTLPTSKSWAVPPDNSLNGIFTAYQSGTPLIPQALVPATTGQPSCTDDTSGSTGSVPSIIGNILGEGLMRNLETGLQNYCKFNTENRQKISLLQGLTNGEINLTEAGRQTIDNKTANGNLANTAFTMTEEAARTTTADAGIDPDTVASASNFARAVRRAAEISIAAQNATALGNVVSAQRVIAAEASNPTAITSTLEGIQAMIKMQGATGEILTAQAVINSTSETRDNRQIALGEQQLRLAKADQVTRAREREAITSAAINLKAVIAGAAAKQKSNTPVTRPSVSPTPTVLASTAPGTGRTVATGLGNLSPNN
jgi:hypothetical protein